MNNKILPVRGVSCNSKYPCHKYFSCPRCARIRQSRIARTIETPSREQLVRTWQVYKILPDTHIPSMTARLTRELRPIVAGGMWSIEYGSKGMGLHLNLLTAGDSAPLALDIAGLQYRWQSAIGRDEMGFVGAYCTKFEQLPPREVYAGRTVALFGDWRGRDAKPLRDLTIREGGECMRIRDVFATMAQRNGKHLGRALVNANALLAIIREVAPEVMSGFERDRSRARLDVAIATLNRLERTRAGALSD